MHLEDFCLRLSGGVKRLEASRPPPFRASSVPVQQVDPSVRRRHHERGHGAQRGQPQHPGDEQQGNVAVLHPGHWAAARGPSQHPVRERARGVDPHQPHSQPGETRTCVQLKVMCCLTCAERGGEKNLLRCVSAVHVPAAAHCQRDALRDARPGQGSPAHPLGADGLWGPVHGFPEVPHHHAHCPVSPAAVFTGAFLLELLAKNSLNLSYI